MHLTEVAVAPPTPAPVLAPPATDAVADSSPAVNTTDNGEAAENLTGTALPIHTLNEAEYLDNQPTPSRYVLKELAACVLILAYLEEGMHSKSACVFLAFLLTDWTVEGNGAPESVCTACLQMAIGGKTPSSQSSISSLAYPP